jgi:hypothetical protein
MARGRNQLVPEATIANVADLVVDYTLEASEGWSIDRTPRASLSANRRSDNFETLTL